MRDWVRQKEEEQPRLESGRRHYTGARTLQESGNRIG